MTMSLNGGPTVTGRTFLSGSYAITSPQSLVTSFIVRDVRTSGDDGRVFATLGAKSETVDYVVAGIAPVTVFDRGILCNGWGVPGHPFTYREDGKRVTTKGVWSRAAIRMEYGDLEIVLTDSTKYWSTLVDASVGRHAVMGVRRKDRAPMPWTAFSETVSMVQAFIGWLGCCSSPVYHVKGYTGRRLSYCAYNLAPNPTKPRGDEYSWMPIDESLPTQDLFNSFSSKWKENVEKRSTFHSALEMLRSRSKGSQSERPAFLYLRDVFQAIAILAGLLSDEGKKRSSRVERVRHAIRRAGVDNRLPLWNHKHVEVMKKHDELWLKGRGENARLDEDSYKKMEMSRPLANVTNWLLHMDETVNAGRLLSLPREVQKYLLDVAVWLADLLVLEFIGYKGPKLNRFDDPPSPKALSRIN